MDLLECEFETVKDVACIEPIKKQDLEKIVTASQKTLVDRCAPLSNVSMRHCAIK